MLSLKAAKTEMKQRLMGRIATPGAHTTVLPDVMLYRRNAVEKPRNCLYKPMIVYFAQGRKAATQGEGEVFFDENELLIVAIDYPTTTTLLEASEAKPSLAVSVDLDMNLIGQLAQATPYATLAENERSAALMTQPIDADMLDAFLRLITVLERPEEAPVLGPMIIKEIHFRLLRGPNGEYLRNLHSYGTQKNHVALAVSWLRTNFKSAFRVEELAEKVHMSASTFHRHFKKITSLSPVQFQKRLRLHEAQRLMLAEDFGIAEVCDAVGYENIAQFTREYKRLFGDPPRRDMMRWKQMEAPLGVSE
ncbi:MAG: AraC family transcriptional regulator [Deltaproteobacteria bacterium]|jgi:AraC-like DNA-binding protein|nr:AraC family transcriptional regulator [Deltaproteobacteria bacterium]